MTTTRDLRRDLAFCDRVHPGPWHYDGHAYVHDSTGGGPVLEVRGAARCFNAEQQDQIGAFAAEAREGWPEAIKEAIEARESEENHRRFVEETYVRKLLAWAGTLGHSIDDLLEPLGDYGIDHAKAMDELVRRATLWSIAQNRPKPPECAVDMAAREIYVEWIDGGHDTFSVAEADAYSGHLVLMFDDGTHRSIPLCNVRFHGSPPDSARV